MKFWLIQCCFGVIWWVGNLGMPGEILERESLKIESSFWKNCNGWLWGSSNSKKPVNFVFEFHKIPQNLSPLIF